MDEHQTTLQSNSSDAASDDLSNVSVAETSSLRFSAFSPIKNEKSIRIGDKRRRRLPTNVKVQKIKIPHKKKKLIGFNAIKMHFSLGVVHSLSICVKDRLLVV